MRLQALFIFAFVSFVRAHPTGAPDELCDESEVTLTPKHGVTAQSGNSAPYTVTASKNRYNSEKDTIRISIKSNDPNGDFLGFAVAVQDPQTKKIIGRWDPNSRAHPNKCNIITHNDNTPKNDITLIWHPPKGSSGSVNYLVTIVKEKTTFWTKVPVKIRS